MERTDMKTRRVVVLPYDEQWEQDFHDIEKELLSALGALALRIEHVGSTSVKGLSAKPIIDIDIVIIGYSVFDAVVWSLRKIGYIHEGNLGIEGRDAFRYEGKEHLRTHHLYVCPQNSRELHRHIVFRDYLRNNPDVAQRYGEIKEKAAYLYPYDIDRYTEYKASFIEEIHLLCGLKGK